MRGFLVVLCLVAFAYLAGCLENQLDPAIQEESRDALDRFDEAMWYDSGHGITRIHGSVIIAEEEEVWAGKSMDIDFRWTDHSRMMQVSIGGLPMGVYCEFGERAVMKAPGNTMEWRVGDTCFEQWYRHSFSLVPSDLSFVSGQRTQEGLEAVYGNASATMTYHITQGNVTSIGISSDEGDGTLFVEYGTPQHVDVPDADERVGLGIRSEVRVMGSVYSWEAIKAQLDVSTRDFEVQVVDDDGFIRAAFDLIEGQESRHGYVFNFQESGDGYLGAGDTFNITHEDPDWLDHAEVRVYDRWAKSAVLDDWSTPSFGIPALIAAIGLACFRRRA